MSFICKFNYKWIKTILKIVKTKIYFQKPYKALKNFTLNFIEKNKFSKCKPYIYVRVS